MNNKIPDEEKKVKISISVDPFLDKKIGEMAIEQKFLIVRNQPLLWGRKITVQVVTPTTPLFDRGEMTDENEENLVVIETISI